jgi:hypothetical protein
MRIITVETEKFRRTVTYDGNDDSRPPGDMGPLTKSFLACESLVQKVAGANTVQVRVEKHPAVPRRQ